MRCFRTYSIPCVQRNSAISWKMLTNLSSSGRSILGLVGDMFEHEKAGCRCRDTILRFMSLNQVHTMLGKWSRTYALPLRSSRRTKSIVPGAFLSSSWLIQYLCEEQFWHEWARCSCVCGFASSKVHHDCFRTENRGFSPTKCPVCIITQQTPWQMLRILCQSGRSIQCLVGDMSEHQKARCRYNNPS